MRDWLAHRARASPDATALVDAADGTEWTYADLDAAVEATAGRLAALGVDSGDHLGVLLPTRVAFVRLAHAAMRLGAVLVPLNVRLAAPELSRQAAHADLSLLVCGRDTEADAVAAASAEDAPDVPVASVDSPDGETVAALREQERDRDRERDEFAPATWTQGDPQAMLFTSGTTGDPKAVVLSMGNFLASATASAFRLGVHSDDRWHLCLPMYHTGGLAPVLRSTLYGTTVVFQRTFDADATLAAMAEHGATGVSLVPTMLRRLLDAGELPDSLRFVLLGGAPASAELLDRCELREVPVYPTYGMTETASQISTAAPEEAFDHPGTVGRPLLFTDVTVVDEDGAELPSGEPGELAVAGPTVTAGYYGNPTATDAAFDDEGRLRTGDVGYADESGRLWVLNRRDDRIVTGGENVHPGEVVEVLREHPAVRDAAVVGLDDPEWGEQVAALVVPDPDAEADLDLDSGLSPDDIDAHCRDRLAGYKCPRTVAFADELPRTASGTVEREAVRERLRERDGD